MGYDLGIDLGGTSVAAAVHRGSRVQMVPLGDRTMTVPAVVFLGEDGVLVAGEPAARRAVGHPDRLGRELRRRSSDGDPVRLGGTPYPPATLLGVLLRDVVAQVARAQGEAPDHIRLAHPAHWSAARREAFTEAIRATGLPAVDVVTEPEAVAAHYASTGRLAEGDTVAVYDLGGSSFDATVLRRTAAGIELLGAPEGIDRLGGGTFDEAVLSHVNQATDSPLAGLDRRDTQAAAAVARLRQECLLAKETLTVETSTTIPVLLPNRRAEVPLSRAEFEQMIHTSIETTVGTLLKALQAAGVEPAELDAVLLVGGSARIPLVTKLVTGALARPTVLDAHPKFPVALGAALLAGATASDGRADDGRADAEAQPDPSARPGLPRRADRPSEGDRPGRADHAGEQNGSEHREPSDQPQPPTLPAQPERWARPTPAAAAAAIPADRPNGALTGSRATSTRSAAATAQSSPVSLFEPFQPVGGPVTTTIVGTAPGTSGTTTEGGAAATDAVTDTDSGETAPTTSWSRTGGSLPSFMNGDTTVIPTQRPDTPEPAFPERAAAEPGAGDRPAVAALLDGPLPPSSSTPDPDPGSTGRRRPTVAALVALAMVAVLAGIGYTLWSGGSDTPPGTAAAPAPAAPGQPAGPAPAISVPVPSAGRSVPVGETPGFVVVSPDGRQALVANQAAGVVTVLDTATNAVTARIPVPTGPPQYLAFSPDGRRVYVSIWDQARTVAAVGVLDTTTRAVIATIPVRTRPYLSAVTPDGQRLYVPNHDSGTVSVIDTGTNTVTTEIKVAPNPHWIEMSGDGTRAYAANHESNLISVIDTADNSVLAEVPVQTSPHSVAVHPNRPLVANVNYDSASVTMIDTNTDRVVATIPVGKNPQDITWAPDGRHAYVANTTDGTVSVIDGETATVTATVPAGGSPTSIAVLPDGTAAYVSNLDDGTLTVLDLAG